MRTTFENPRRTSSADSVATDILLRAERPATVAAFLGEVLPMLLPALEGDFAAVTLSGWGSRTVAEAGLRQNLPSEIVAEVLDREAAHNFGDWLAAPLAHREPNAEVLVVHRTAAAAHRDDGANGIASFEELSAAVGAGLRMVRARQRLRQCAKQSETILSIVQQWSHTQEMETLLNQMAEASIQLLEADRASIFLWDRENHMLVGRPALGVPGGELRVPDNAGVVGKCCAPASRDGFRHARRTIR